MSSPVTEIVVLPASDALKADHSIFPDFKRALAERTTSGGMLEQFWGFREEEPETWQGFLHWISLEHHRKMVPVLETDKEFGEAIGRMISGPAKVFHVSFEPFDSAKKAIAAPLTEVVVANVKEGVDVQEFKDAIEYALDTAAAVGGCVRGAWGFTVEDAKQAVMVVGWQSHEAHLKYETTQEIMDSGIRFMKVGNVEKKFYIRLQ